MTSRDEWSEGPWGRIRDRRSAAGTARERWADAAEHRAFVKGVLWVLRSGARGSDGPERYGQYKTVPKRLARWATSGVWDRVFRLLSKDVNNEHSMIDSTLVRAHQPAATGKKGARTRLGAFPRRVDH